MKPLLLELPKGTEKSIKCFFAGVVMGLLISVIFWNDTQEWHPYPLSLTQGVTVSLGVAIICGLLSLKWTDQFLKVLRNTMMFIP